MAGIWMAVGVDKNNTGSFDTYWDLQIIADNYNYAYLGIQAPTTPTSQYTFPTGSRGSYLNRDLQMYTPYPTGTDRGKLYFVQLSSFTTDYAAIESATGLASKFVELSSPTGGVYYIITPSLNDPTLSTSSHIAQYAFTDEDDLFTNGWKSQSGLTSASNPLSSPALWGSFVNDASWLNPPFNFNPATAGDKAQIVANLLAYTTNSYNIQISSPLDLIKGAVVLGGTTTPFASNPFYAGIVPLKG